MRDEFDKLRRANLDDDAAKSYIKAFTQWTVRRGIELERRYGSEVDWEAACFTALYRAAYGYRPGKRKFFGWYLCELRGEMGARLRTYRRRKRAVYRPPKERPPRERLPWSIWEDRKAEIEALRDAGWSQARLAAHYGVDFSTISGYVKRLGISWRSGTMRCPPTSPGNSRSPDS